MPEILSTEHTETQRERVRSFFDASRSWQGDFYTEGNEYFSRLLRRRRDLAARLLLALPRSGEGQALDIGCGSGVYIEHLLSLGYETTGIDLSAEMIEACTRRFRSGAETTPPVHLQTGDVEHLPFEDNRFDLVLCVGVLGYLLEDERALTEISRVLKPGGSLLVNVTNAYALSDLDTRLRKKLRVLFSPRRGATVNAHMLPYAIQSEWMMKNRKYANKSYKLGPFEDLLTEHGFTLRDSLTFGFEFRVVRRMHLAPSAVLDAFELFLERASRTLKVPYFSRAGWGYIGLFTKKKQ